MIATGHMCVRQRVARRTDVVLTAVWRSGLATSLLHSSDAGVNAAVSSLQRWLADLGVACSMRCAGNARVSALMESFFSTMKIECCHRR